MKLRIAPVLKSISIASVALIVACGGKKDATTDAAPAAAADATAAPAPDAAAAPAPDAAAAPAPDAAAAAPAFDTKPFEKMLGYQEAIIGVVEANKTDLESAKKAVQAWIDTNKADIKATMTEMQALGEKLQGNPAEAQKVMAGFQEKAMKLQEREKALETALPGISEAISTAMAAALAPEGAPAPGGAPAPTEAPAAPTEAPKPTQP